MSLKSGFMDHKFGCRYKLRSGSQSDNEMNIFILHLLVIVGILERGKEIKPWYKHIISGALICSYWIIIYPPVSRLCCIQLCLPEIQLMLSNKLHSEEGQPLHSMLQPWKTFTVHPDCSAFLYRVRSPLSQQPMCSLSLHGGVLLNEGVHITSLTFVLKQWIQHT